MDWIDVKDRLPENVKREFGTDNAVIVYEHDISDPNDIVDYTYIARYEGQKNGKPIWNDFVTECKGNLNITHWMPIPEPPK